MNTVIKTSWDFKKYDAQIVNPSFVEFEKLLRGDGNLSFRIPVDNPHVIFFSEFKKVSFFEIQNGKDVLLWSGIVSEVSYSFTEAEIKCKQEKTWLQEKIIYEEKDWASVNSTVAIQEVVDEINARKYPVEDNISISSFFSKDITKKFSKGSDLYDMIEEIIDLIGGEWDMVENKIIIKEKLGVDRTSGENFFEVVSNTKSPNESNIAGADYTATSNEVTNAILGKGGDFFSEKNEEVYGSPRIEKFISYSEGDIVEQVSSELETRKSPHRVIEAVTTPSIPMYIEVGDTIVLRISRDIGVLNTVQNVRVIKKTITMKSGFPEMKLGLSDVNHRIKDALSFFSGVSSDIKKLQISAL